MMRVCIIVMAQPEIKGRELKNKEKLIKDKGKKS
jgi:hypothetical protein